MIVVVNTHTVQGLSSFFQERRFYITVTVPLSR